MAETRLVRFAQYALSVSKTVMPKYRGRFSKHIFVQPQQLAILCLIRYKGWIFREADVRLVEHEELRKTHKQIRDHELAA